MAMNFNELNNYICENIEEVLSKFDIDLKSNGSFYVGPCPIHGGDNRTAFNIFVDGHTRIGNWICHTHHCEEHFVNNAIGFIRGVLSHKKLNWSQKGNNIFSFNKTIEILKQVLQLSDISKCKNKKKFDVLTSSVIAVKEKSKTSWSKKVVREKLLIPSQYFLSRGYSKEILDKYDVGDSKVSEGLFSNRAVVPIYEDDGKRVVGFTGRTTLKDFENLKISKWCNSKGFSRKDYLYNYNYAKDYIKESGVAILVEGPGDVWRLEEAGIHNSLAVFGSSLTDSQQIILESSGALCLVLLFDTDSAGTKAKEKVQSSLSRMFNILNPDFPEGYKDIGEMKTEEVKEFLVPILEKLICRR
jgi:5S rRNA maturation endonuclease (ribonuclease M5)